MAAVRGHSDPKQDRSRRTFEKILAASELLLISRTLSEISIQEICAAAGVKRGAFYARFPDKDALVQALFDRHAEEVGVLLDEFERQRSDSGDTLEKFLSGLITLYLDLYQHRRGIIRAIEATARHNTGIREQHAELEAGALNRFLAQGFQLQPELAESGSRRIVEFTIPTVLAAIRAAVDRPVEFGEMSIHSREELVADLTQLALSQMGLVDPTP